MSDQPYTRPLSLDPVEPVLTRCRRLNLAALADLMPKLPSAPDTPAPMFRDILDSIDNEHRLRQHARALAIADHAAMVDYSQRQAEYLFYITQAAQLGDPPVLVEQRGQKIEKDLGWWGNVWTATYADTRDDLNAGLIPRVELRDLDAEWQEEQREQPSFDFFGVAALMAAAGRGGVAQDEADPYDVT
jgi:hypothetical protein